MRVIRDVLVETILAGGLTSLVLGHGLLAAFLLLVGFVLLSMVMRGRDLFSFGASRKPTTTSSTGL